jgi:hypothetical protein
MRLRPTNIKVVDEVLVHLCSGTCSAIDCQISYDKDVYFEIVRSLNIFDFMPINSSDCIDVDGYEWERNL